MASLRSVLAPRAVRSPAPVLLVALGLAVGWGEVPPPADVVLGGHVTADYWPVGLPNGLAPPRGLDLDPSDRARHRGPPAARRAFPGSGGRADRGEARSGANQADAPAGYASRALRRAGRLSAPATAPPLLS